MKRVIFIVCKAFIHGVSDSWSTKMSVEDVMHLGILDNHLTFPQWMKLMATSKEVGRQIPDDIKTLLDEFPTKSARERDHVWGLMDVHSQNDILPDCCPPRKGVNAISLFDTKQLACTPPFDMSRFRLEIDTMSRNLLIPLWRAELPIVVAGGSVEKALRGARLHEYPDGTEIDLESSDFDIFIIGNKDVEQVAESIMDIWEASKLCHIQRFDHKRNQTRNVNLIKARLTVQSSHQNTDMFYAFDIIVEPFHDVVDLITQFDLDCSRFAYDGRKVFTTLSGWTAFCTRTNVLDRADMEFIDPMNLNRRILKYAFRGYKTILHDIVNADMIRAYCARNAHAKKLYASPTLKSLVGIDHLLSRHDALHHIVKKCLSHWRMEMYSFNCDEVRPPGVWAEQRTEWYCRDIEHETNADEFVTATEHLWSVGIDI